MCAAWQLTMAAYARISHLARIWNKLFLKDMHSCVCNAIQAHAQTALTEFLGHRQVQGLNTEYERLRKENEGASTGKGKASGTSEGSTSLQSLRKEIQSLQVVLVQHLSRSKLPAYTALPTLFAIANIYWCLAPYPGYASSLGCQK